MTKDFFLIPTITVDKSFNTIFSEELFPKTLRGGMLLTDRIDAQNFRLRESASGYSSDWHVAGDPTLIIIQRGVLRIILRDGSYNDFAGGDMFIAKDYLPTGVSFDNTLHGHRAEVLGKETLQAVHIKLSIL